MAYQKDYQAPNPIPVEEIAVGVMTTVPVWRAGQIVDWALGKITEVYVPSESWLVYIEKYKTTAMYFAHSLNKPIDKSGWLISGALNWYQQLAIEHIRSVNVDASWFIGQRAVSDGSVEVVAIGNVDSPFVWTFTIELDGSYTSSEATDVEFSTGITV